MCIVCDCVCVCVWRDVWLCVKGCAVTGPWGDRRRGRASPGMAALQAGPLSKRVSSPGEQWGREAVLSVWEPRGEGGLQQKKVEWQPFIGCMSRRPHKPVLSSLCAAARALRDQASTADWTRSGHVPRGTDPVFPWALALPHPNAVARRGPVLLQRLARIESGLTGRGEWSEHREKKWSLKMVWKPKTGDWSNPCFQSATLENSMEVSQKTQNRIIRLVKK